MKFSEKWLREWVDPAIDTSKLAEQLTMAGLEVDAVEPVAVTLDKVVIGRVESLRKHPDAEKLKICTVAVGADQPLTIVCGASNVTQGGIYPVALIGASLPNGLSIKKAKLRGVESYGMLCSANELGIAEHAEGLFELPEDAPIAESVFTYLQLDDKSITLGLTPNRGDCLSIRGIAREVGVINKLPVNTVDIAQISPQSDVAFPVEIVAPQDCPRYVGRVIKNINSKAQTPLWMKERLRRSSVRCLHPVVDVTNYVMLELGQPMHAFDLDKLRGGIRIRIAQNGEKIVLLDGQEINLQPGTLVIGDHQQPQAIAGIMGGNAAAVSAQTCDVFLESAFFSPHCISGKARKYGLHTDSSHRFERGVDPALQRLAVERATQLLLEIVGGEPGQVVEVLENDYLPKPRLIRLRPERIKRVLGIPIDVNTVTDILHRLGMSVKEQPEGWWTVVSPSYRFDIEREEDLIEEIVRIYGYQNIPTSRPSAPVKMLPQSEATVKLRTIRSTLVERGYNEAITYSFVDPGLQALFKTDRSSITLANPISADLAEMRTSLWPGLINALSHNLNRQQNAVRLFETGLRFYYKNKELIQETTIAAAITGNRYPEQWCHQEVKLDFYDIKSDVEALLSITGARDQFIFIPDKLAALHPGQSAKVVRKVTTQESSKPTDSYEVAGWLGVLHPAIQQKLDLPQVLIFELKLSAILQRRVPQFKAVSKFPAVRRDLAIVVDKAVSSQTVSDSIRKATPATLQNLKLFDVYQGKGIDSGRKSLAYGLTLQAQERTLTDQDVEKVVDQILTALNKELGATLRN